MADTILSALNELVEKQGGETKDNKLIVDAIKDLVNTSGGGSSGGVKILRYNPRGGFRKGYDEEAGETIYYTYDEIVSFYEQSNGLLFGEYNTSRDGVTHICKVNYEAEDEVIKFGDLFVEYINETQMAVSEYGYTLYPDTHEITNYTYVISGLNIQSNNNLE